MEKEARANVYELYPNNYEAMHEQINRGELKNLQDFTTYLSIREAYWRKVALEETVHRDSALLLARRLL